MNKRGKQRRLRIRAVRRNPPDLKKLSRALIELAQAQAETEAEADHAEQAQPEKRPTHERDGDSPEAA